MKEDIQTVKTGFPPVYDKNSRVLILGGFPSVKSREISFYYGNKQNRFWKMLCGYFKREIPQDIFGKKEFLLENKIALWDIAVSCEIVGSSDSSVKNAQIAELDEIFRVAKIEKILLNGSLAYELFMKKYANVSTPYIKMPSTSPANPRYDQQVWWGALDAIF